jgi:hypothetical protein
MMMATTPHLAVLFSGVIVIVLFGLALNRLATRCEGRGAPRRVSFLARMIKLVMARVMAKTEHEECRVRPENVLSVSSR